MGRELHDHYFREAKREGYRSRAAYKLIEIDDRKSVMRRGDVVLDCGAAPGSWLQVASKRIGPRGLVVGVDLKPIEGGLGESNITVTQGDVCELTTAVLVELIEATGRQPTTPAFDVLLSDMAPDTTGDHNRDHHHSVRLCHGLLDRCVELLRPSGSLVMKVFEGEVYPELLARTRTAFEKVKGFVPKASRQQSREIYVIGHGFGGAMPSTSVENDENTIPIARRRTPAGWGGKRPRA